MSSVRKKLFQQGHPEWKKGRGVWEKEIRQFSTSTVFGGLSILSFEPGEGIASVTFFAQLSQGGQDVSFTERSLFKKEDGRWKYVSGTFPRL